MATFLGNATTTPSELLRKLPGWSVRTSQSQLSDSLGLFRTGWSAWQYAVTFLLGMVVYDQGKSNTGHDQVFRPRMEQADGFYSVMYLHRKGSIPGPRFKIPLTGPFIQALHPKFEAYLAQWASGPLSCVSIFHK
jgi:C-22 sterol desaturase